MGWLLAAVALLGATLILARPLDERWHPELFTSAPASPSVAAAPLESIRQRLLADFGRNTDLNFRPPRVAGESLRVAVRGSWNGIVYFDPATGVEQGRRGDSEGFVNVVFKLHNSLFLGDAGKAILACAALGYLVLLASGLVLWWPRRWPPSLRIELRQGLVRGLFSLHRSAGAVMGIFIAVSVATGAWMAWRPLGDAVNFLAGAKAVKPPPLPELASVPATHATIDLLAARAQARFPRGVVGYIQVPAKPTRAVRVRIKAEGDPHPNGLSSVWLDPRSGDVLAVNTWNRLDPATRATAILYPLHTGELGGPLLESLVFLNGVTLGALGISGLTLWWKRRRRRV